MVIAGDQRSPRTVSTSDGDTLVTWHGNGPGDDGGDLVRRWATTFAPHYGGGIENVGTLQVTGTTIDHNRAGANGGGLHNTGTASVSSSLVSSNATPVSSHSTAFLSETRINTQTAASQSHARIAAASDGRSVVVWMTLDGDSLSYWGQRFDSTGAASGTQFQIGATVTTPVVGSDDSWRADVAMAPTGEFAVGSSCSQVPTTTLRPKCLRDGTVKTSAFIVNTSTDGFQSHPSVAFGPSGAFAIVWQDSQGYDGSLDGVFGRVFDSAGAPLSNEFLVDSTSWMGRQYGPDVSMDAAGDLVITWTSADGASDSNIYGGRFNQQGEVQHWLFLVNTQLSGHQVRSVVGMAPSGECVIVWPSLDQDGSGWGLYASAYDRLGNLVGDEFPVTQQTTGDQLEPSVVMLDDGSFIIAWESNDREDGTSPGVYLRRFAADALPMGDQILVNETTDGYQRRPSIAVLPDGSLLAVWDGNGRGEDTGVFVREVRFESVPASTGNGGGIANKGTLELTNVTLSGNVAAVQGGGLHNATGATATTTNCTVTANEAQAEGGIASLGLDGEEFRVNSSITGTQAFSDAAIASSGDFVVVWESDQVGQGSVVGQRFSAAGVPQGDEFHGTDSSVPAPVVWFTGEETADDAVGNNDGALQGAVSFVPGMVGQALSFDGSSAVNAYKMSNSFEFRAGDFTIEAWIRSTTTTGYQTILSNNSGTAMYNLYLYPQGQLYLDARDGNGNYVAVTDTTVSLADGMWHHVAGTRHSSEFSIFVDGIKKATVQDAAVGSVTTSNTYARIGGVNSSSYNSPTSSENFFQGQIDELSLFQCSLSDADIAAIYSAGAAGKAPLPGPTVWYAAEGTADDAVANCDGATQGAVAFVPGKVGQAFSLDGSSAVNVYKVSNLFEIGVGDFTIEAWIRSGSATGAYQAILSNYGGIQQYNLDLTPQGYLRLNARDGNENYVDVIDSSMSLADGLWHHVAGTRRGSEFSIYVDGIRKSTVHNAAVGSVIASTAYARIGGANSSSVNSPTSNQSFFHGEIDELSLFQRSLSDADIVAIFLAALQANCPLIHVHDRPSTWMPPGISSWLGRAGRVMPSSGVSSHSGIRQMAHFSADKSESTCGRTDTNPNRPSCCYQMEDSSASSTMSHPETSLRGDLTRMEPPSEKNSRSTPLPAQGTPRPSVTSWATSW